MQAPATCYASPPGLTIILHDEMMLPVLWRKILKLGEPNQDLSPKLMFFPLRLAASLFLSPRPACGFALFRSDLQSPSEIERGRNEA